MDKLNLIIRLTNKLDITIDQSTEIVNTLLELLKDALVAEGTVQLRGFGKFSIHDWGLGPVIKFKASGPLKRRIRGG